MQHAAYSLFCSFVRDEILLPFKKKCGLWAIVVNKDQHEFTVMACRQYSRPYRLTRYAGCQGCR